MLRKHSIISLAILVAIALLIGCTTEGKKPDLVYFEVDMILPPVGISNLAPSEINNIHRHISIGTCKHRLHLF